MPWFVCFDFPPATAFGVFERRGNSYSAETREEAIQLAIEYWSSRGIDVSRYRVDSFQYHENEA